MENDRHVIIVGIGGVSNGGKTTLSNGLVEALRNDGLNVDVIHQDDYFKKEEDVPFHQSQEFRRWDEMVAFDMDQMVTDVKKHVVKLKESDKLSVLVIEGILVFNHRDLNVLFSSRYLLTLNFDEARKRRLTRTYEPPDTQNIFNDHVWPMYVKYLDEIKAGSVPVEFVDGCDPKDQTLQKVLNDTMGLIRRNQ